MTCHSVRFILCTFVRFFLTPKFAALLKLHAGSESCSQDVNANKMVSNVIVVFFINLWFDYSLQQKYDFTFLGEYKKDKC